MALPPVLIGAIAKGTGNSFFFVVMLVTQNFLYMLNYLLLGSSCFTIVRPLMVVDENGSIYLIYRYSMSITEVLSFATLLLQLISNHKIG